MRFRFTFTVIQYYGGDEILARANEAFFVLFLFLVE